jgi:MYXO-CTERM domain-containing protein
MDADAGIDAGMDGDAGNDAGMDGDAGNDAGMDGDAGNHAGMDGDAGNHAGMDGDAGNDAGMDGDAGSDGGPQRLALRVGCGCSSGAATLGVWWTLAIGLLMLSRSRRHADGLSSRKLPLGECQGCCRVLQ